MRKIIEWWKKVIYEEYHLTVWYQKEAAISKEGVKTITRSKHEYKLKKITKKSPNHIIGKDINGRAFEIRTVEPFDYQIRKIY